MAESTLATDGLHRVETVMGIPVGIDVRDAGADPAALERAFAHLHAVDAAFSPYRAESDVRRLDAGTLALPEARPEVRAVLARCERLRRSTGGWFDVRATGPLDPSGFVKGWAVDGAVGILRAAGAGSVCVHAGGDVRVTGARAPGVPWRIGVQHQRARRGPRPCAATRCSRSSPTGASSRPAAWMRCGRADPAPARRASAAGAGAGAAGYGGGSRSRRPPRTSRS